MNDIELIETIKEIGFLLLKNGAEIYRVEESIKKMCKGMGFNNVEVFVIPTFFSISVTLHDGTPYTTTKRSRKTKVHLDHLYTLNDLVRKISNQEIDREDIRQYINKLENHKYHQPLILLGYIISAASFSVFFKGGLKEMIAGAIIGLILYIATYMQELVNVNSIAKTTFSSMLLATMAILFQRYGLIDNSQAVITGTLMILVPGIAITNSLRDIIGGDYVSGVSRLGEAIFIAASIAVGVGIMMIVLGGM